MSLDLTEMSRKELLQLQKDVEKALKDAEQRERTEALKAVEKAAAEYGFSLDEVLTSPNKGAARKSKATPKYRNPENPDETWTGRGRKPHWVHAALSKGVDISELEI
ncbi:MULTISPECIES: H-NS histone family protein [unclassified Epibacterium]|jgi:DNA-binding protein H-NS|uniref:H-NS histone family protein n=1 Tax=unclassified Epibacterium TaxID=2639179 RepID=UPI001EF64DD0|nr:MULTISPECIES: H-NS histone family protein [unclassified Epibacterium]MCG7622022.1 H-NS histone family protein [Epibacterium sp. Ofav1-8]MCG7626988.1 H-NS histone family protein [Epibacterium sp. MM17-32]